MSDPGHLLPLCALARLPLPPCRVSAVLISQSLADDDTDLWQVDPGGECCLVVCVLLATWVKRVCALFHGSTCQLTLGESAAPQ